MNESPWAAFAAWPAIRPDEIAPGDVVAVFKDGKFKRWGTIDRSYPSVLGGRGWWGTDGNPLVYPYEMSDGALVYREPKESPDV